MIDQDSWVTQPVKKDTQPAKNAVGRQLLLQDRLDTLKSYIGMLVEAEDWHGVMGAAADIREIEAELKGIASAD